MWGNRRAAMIRGIPAETRSLEDKGCWELVYI